jgi:hypothetical protein
MTTDPNTATPAKPVPANDSLESVLAELRHLARQTEPTSPSRMSEPKAPVTQNRPQMPARRPAQNLRPARDEGEVAFPPRVLATAARPRHRRAGTWIVAGGVTLACAALAIPLRSMIFDPLQQDAEVLVEAEPSVAKTEQRAPAEVASTVADATAKEPEATAGEPENATPSTTASLSGQAPAKAEPVLPSVEAPPVVTSELIRSEAPPAAGPAAQPVETASISLIKLPSELKPTASTAGAGAVATASADPVKTFPAAQASAPVLGASPAPVASKSEPAPAPVTEAAPEKTGAPSSAAAPAPAASAVASDRSGNESGRTRTAALGPVPESSATTALVPPPAKPSPETLRMVERARELIRMGDISAARLLLERAMRSGSGQAAFYLAETYDPQMLAQWGTFGIQGDIATARVLYSRALKNGVADSKPRLEALN